MNPHDRGSKFAVASDGLLCQCREFKEWQGCRSTRGVTKGRYYYEVIYLYIHIYLTRCKLMFCEGFLKLIYKSFPENALMDFLLMLITV